MFSYFSVRFATSGYILPRSVPEIEGGYPERDGGGGAEEEGQGLQYSRSLIVDLHSISSKRNITTDLDNHEVSRFLIDAFLLALIYYN